MTALAEESRQLAVDLHRFFADIDRARWCDEARTAASERLAHLRARIEALHGHQDGADPHTTVLSQRLAELRGTLAGAPTIEEGRRAWVRFRARAVPAYEAMAASLRAWSLEVPSVRPTNYKRNAFHVASASLAVAAVELTPVWGILVAIAFALATWAWSMEYLRRRRPELNAMLMRFFAPVAHPHEVHRVNSSTWYVTALAALSTTGYVVPCAVGLIALGYGDPAAALIGRRFGRIKWLYGRTVEGSLAFVVVAAAVATALLFFAHGMPLASAAAVALAGSAAGAVAELLTRRLDDNLTIPLAAWIGAAAALALVA